MYYPWIVVSCARKQVWLILNLVQISDSVLIMYFFWRHYLPLCIQLFNSFSHIVLPRGWFLLFLLSLHYLINIGCLIGVLDFESALNGPFCWNWVCAWPRDYLMHLCLIVQEVASLNNMSPIFLSFFNFQKLPLFNLSLWVEVFLIDVIPFNALLISMVC